MDNVNYYCRLCAESIPSNKLVDVGPEHEMKDKILSKLTRLNCEMDLNDALPTTICFDCLNSLNKAYDFVIMIEAARIALSELFSLEKVKKENLALEVEIPNQPSHSAGILDIKEENGCGDDYTEDVDPGPGSDEEISPVKPETSKRKESLGKKINELLSDFSQRKLPWSSYIWLCTHCETQFSNIDELIAHSMKVHNICNPYRCIDCKIRKLKLDPFLNHIQRHHKHLRASCYKCSESFDSHVTAKEHKSKHLTTNFICPGCNTPFLTKDELQNHVDTYNQTTRTRILPESLQTNDLTCKVCQKSFKKRSTLITHVLSHTDRTVEHVCEVCGRGFNTKGCLAEHLMTHSEDRPHKCEICSKDFRTVRSLKHHVSVHNNDCVDENDRKKSLRKKTRKLKGLDVDSIPLSDLSQMKLSWSSYNWLCTHCETQFSHINELIAHSMEVHNICNPYRCVDCKIRKFKLDRFLIHIQRHHKHLKTSCYKCSEPFDSYMAAREHQSKHLTTNFICTGCNTPFLTKEELQKHMDTYNQASKTRILPKPLQTDSLTCKVCQKSFNRRGPFITHVLLHTDRKAEHICEVCGKAFHTKGNLAEHMTTHFEDRPHKCKLCSQGFRTLRSLKNHVSVHNKEKPFSCEVCGRRFRLPNQLKSHSIIHTDLLPFTCAHCNKRFRFKSILKSHVLLHTGIKPYECKVCSRDFANWSNYNKHMKRKHNMDTSKKKVTPNGCVPIDPKTGEEMVLREETQQLAEWKKQMLIRRRGRPPKSFKVNKSG